jgi:signal transduction histidine kinase
VSAWLASCLSAVGLGLATLTAWRRLRTLREAVARSAHEVRGPLCAARLALELAGRSGTLPAAQLRALGLELDRMHLALIDLERVRGRARTRLELAPVALDRLLADCVDAWRASAEARGIALQAGWSGPPVTVLAERVRLAQALENLIANALEHGCGPVQVRGAVEASGVRLEVLDAGPGLPAPLGDLVRGRRPGRGGPRRGGGLDRGRGLSIVLAAAQAHGGELITAPSQRGARLVLRLPISVAAASAQATGVPS